MEKLVLMGFRVSMLWSGHAELEHKDCTIWAGLGWCIIETWLCTVILSFGKYLLGRRCVGLGSILVLGFYSIIENQLCFIITISVPLCDLLHSWLPVVNLFRGSFWFRGKSGCADLSVPSFWLRTRQPTCHPILEFLSCLTRSRSLLFHIIGQWITC